MSVCELDYVVDNSKMEEKRLQAEAIRDIIAKYRNEISKFEIEILHLEAELISLFKEENNDECFLANSNDIYTNNFKQLVPSEEVDSTLYVVDNGDMYSIICDNVSENNGEIITVGAEVDSDVRLFGDIDCKEDQELFSDDEFDNDVDKQDWLCIKCHESFSSKIALATHKSLHEKHNRKLFCPVCGELYYDWSYFQEHIFCHFGPMPYSCSICNKKFCYEDVLKNHVFQNTCNSDIKAGDSCLTCGKVLGECMCLRDRVDNGELVLESDWQLNRGGLSLPESSVRVDDTGYVEIDFQNDSSGDDFESEAYCVAAPSFDEMKDTKLENTNGDINNATDCQSLLFHNLCKLTANGLDPKEDPTTSTIPPNEYTGSCSECGKKFSGPKSLQRHLNGAHGCKAKNINHEDGYNSFGEREECDDVVNNEASMHACEICGKKYRTMFRFLRHKKTHSQPPTTHTCLVCDKSFTKAYTLKHHMLCHTGERNFKCDKCSKAFFQKPHLQMHMRIHSEVNTVVCEHCGTGFKRKSSLKHHRCTRLYKGASYVKQILKPLLCNICGKVLRGKRSLLMHTHLHYNSEKHHQCSMCPKVFRTEMLLTNHFYARHADLKNFQCDFCGKHFALKSDLKNHVVSHSDARPFQCHLCDKSFRRKTNLNAHLLRHDGVKTFVCDICDRSFFEKRSLRTHSKIHKKTIILGATDILKPNENILMTTPTMVETKIEM